jgi:hypothetical protein
MKGNGFKESVKESVFKHFQMAVNLRESGKLM